MSAKLFRCRRIGGCERFAFARIACVRHVSAVSWTFAEVFVRRSRSDCDARRNCSRSATIGSVFVLYSFSSPLTFWISFQAARGRTRRRPSPTAADYRAAREEVPLVLPAAAVAVLREPVRQAERVRLRRA
jgi:hypothetical protein